MAGLRAPFHFGGPLGLAGLALLAGAAGLFVLAGSPGGPDGPSVPLSGIAESPAYTLPSDQTGRDTFPASGDTSFGPAGAGAEPGAPVPQPAGPDVITAQATGAEVTFVVRIKGAPEIDNASRLFRKDRAAAEQAFAEYVRRTPALADFTLVGASYSGEIKLAYQMPPGVEPTRAQIRLIQDRIMAVEGVAYADPDFIAHPGKED